MRTLQTDENGDFIIINGSPVIITGAKAVRQRLENKIKLFIGQLADLDPAWAELGIDWIDIFDSGINIDYILGIVKQILLDDEYVDFVEQIDGEINRQTRKLSITFTARGVEGLVAGSVIIRGQNG